MNRANESNKIHEKKKNKNNFRISNTIIKKNNIHKFSSTVYFTLHDFIQYVA